MHHTHTSPTGHTYTQDLSVVLVVICYVLQTKSETHMHAHAHKYLPSTEKLSLLLGSLFLGPAFWMHMQQHVLRVSNPSSKQTANHTDRKICTLLSEQQPWITGCPVLKCFHTLRVLTNEKEVLILAYSNKQADGFFYLLWDKTLSPFHKVLKKKQKRQKKSSLVCGGVNWLVNCPTWISYFDSSHTHITVDYTHRVGKWQQNCYVPGFSNSFINFDSCHDKLKD